MKSTFEKISSSFRNEGEGFYSENSTKSIYSKFQKKRNEAPRAPQGPYSFSADSVLRDSLNFYECFSPFPTSIQGLPGATLAILSFLLLLHPCALTQHLYSASALTQGSKPTILYFWAMLGTWKKKIPPKIFHNFLKTYLRSELLKLIHLTSQTLINPFLPCLFSTTVDKLKADFAFPLFRLPFTRWATCKGFIPGHKSWRWVNTIFQILLLFLIDIIYSPVAQAWPLLLNFVFKEEPLWIPATLNRR